MLSNQLNKRKINFNKKVYNKRIIKRSYSQINSNNTVQIVSNLRLSRKFEGREELVKKASVKQLHQMFATVVPPSAPLLLLAGNIGKPSDHIYYNFIEYCSKNFSKIFVVPGFDELCEDDPNANYQKLRNYNKSHTQLKNIMGSHSNTFYLNNKICSLTDDYDIIGITFGSRKYFNVLEACVDLCTYEIDPELPNYLDEIFRPNLEKLKELIKDQADSDPTKKLLIMSDFVPKDVSCELKTNPNYSGLHQSYLELQNLVKNNSNIKIWASGDDPFESVVSDFVNLLHANYDHYDDKFPKKPVTLNLSHY